MTTASWCNFLSTNEGKLDKLQRDAKTAGGEHRVEAPCPSGGRGLGSLLENFPVRAAGWLIWGQELALWVAGRCLWRHALRGSGSPLFFSPPTVAVGAAVALSLVLAGPRVGAGLPLPAGLTLLPTPSPGSLQRGSTLLGESLQDHTPSVFFPVFVRFIRSYKVSRREVFKEKSGSEKLGRGREGWASSLGLFLLLL